MKMQPCAPGALAACLMMLSACTNALPCPEVRVIETGCPKVEPCRLPGAELQTNGDLMDDSEVLLEGWHDCAAKVDMIIACQEAR